MCEWLSYNAWYDVKLLCGGHAFNAHRVVLASVSSFLRQILISCQTEETPILIVLPDFDLEALSSVLYYIYNGQVMVQKERLDRFLDIIKAFQIFIDIQYFGTNSCDGLQNMCAVPLVTPISQEIYTLGLTEYGCQNYIKIKRGNEIKMPIQYSLNNANSYDKQEHYQKRSERRRSLGNLKSSLGDRQRNSFLRDLYIETYPRNGNVNGQAVGVLAISNECYRAPTSVLFTNANDQHLSARDALLDTYKNATWYPSHFSRAPSIGDQIQCAQHFKQNVDSVHSRTTSCGTSNGTDSDYINRNEENYNFNAWNGWQNQILKPSNLSLLPVTYKEEMLSKADAKSMDLTITKLNVPLKNIPLDKSEKFPYAPEDEENNVKICIHNQVLENPWRSQAPNFFRPRRRKSNDYCNKHHLDGSIMKKCVISDNNNNVESSMNRDLVVARKEIEKCLTLKKCEKDYLKCHICNQVFTCSEMLTAHMKRHTTNARYSCSECGKTFSQLRNFKYHMSIHRGTREFAATCTVCGKYFNDRGYLSSHMKIHRNRKEYKCVQCPKSFNQRVAYNMHMRIHTGVKPHVCEECGKAFSRKMLLKQHQRTHSGERPYSCPHCDKRFADRSNMTLHLRLHTGVKPFSCTLCPKSFTKKHHLKSHLNFHTGLKPYSCPRCNLAFTQSSNMRTHLKKCNVPEVQPPLTSSVV